MPYFKGQTIQWPKGKRHTWRQNTTQKLNTEKHDPR